MLITKTNRKIKFSIIYFTAEKGFRQTITVSRSFAMGKDHIAVQCIFIGKIKHGMIC